MGDDELERRRSVLEAEQRFIDERGGRQWIATFIEPYYLKWMGYGAAELTEVQPLIPAVRDRANELNVADLSTMVSMQWRIQVMGTWYAIARADEAFTAPLHRAFDTCYGSLTSPALSVAVLMYPDGSTATVLRAYRERATARQHGDSGVIDAALRRLGSNTVASERTDADDLLDRLLDVARQLAPTND